MKLLIKKMSSIVILKNRDRPTSTPYLKLKNSNKDFRVSIIPFQYPKTQTNAFFTECVFMVMAILFLLVREKIIVRGQMSLKLKTNFLAALTRLLSSKKKLQGLGSLKKKLFKMNRLIFFLR